jgi:hypothetical protein
VSVQVLDGPSATTLFTAVTVINVGTSVTVNFCGNQQNLFPLNTVVRADFTSGSTCSTVVSVVVIG